jgi:hypothetical protein
MLLGLNEGKIEEDEFRKVMGESGIMQGLVAKVRTLGARGVVQ